MQELNQQYNTVQPPISSGVPAKGDNFLQIVIFLCQPYYRSFNAGDLVAIRTFVDDKIPLIWARGQLVDDIAENQVVENRKLYLPDYGSCTLARVDELFELDGRFSHPPRAVPMIFTGALRSWYQPREFAAFIAHLPVTLKIGGRSF